MKLTESSWLHCISYFLFPFSSWVTTHLQISMLNRWPQGHFNLPPSTKRWRRNCSLESLKGTRNQSCVPPCSCNNDSQMLENSVTEQRASFSKSNFRTQTHTHTGTRGFQEQSTRIPSARRVREEPTPCHHGTDTSGAVPFATAKSATAEAKKMLGQTGPVRTLGGFLAE